MKRHLLSPRPSLEDSTGRKQAGGFHSLTGALRCARLALLTALSLVLFAAEAAFPPPMPFPGAKLGLANVVTVMALFRLSARETALMLFARILLSALFSGNAGALLFSLSGGTACLAGCLLLRKTFPFCPFWLVSAAGGVLHNMGQLVAAAAAVQTAGLLAYLPFLTVAGALCGTLTGVLAQLLIRRLARAVPFF